LPHLVNAGRWWLSNRRHIRALTSGRSLAPDINAH
jgi:hypothetical protein